jgi:TfoX/Sxy family transcriptional regulator of competence genes
MAYDAKLAERVRVLLIEQADVVERHMFGGLTFMVGGHMCCGVNRDELIIRVDPARETRLLTRKHCRPMDFTRRPMTGFIAVEPEALTPGGLKSWIQEAVTYAESLPQRPATS